MVPVFDAMELVEALLFKISRKVGLQTNKIKDYKKTKALVNAFSSEIDQLLKENKMITKVLKALEEQLSSSDQSRLCRLTQEMKSS